MRMSKRKEAALVPRLRFPEFRCCGEWESKQLGELCKLTRGPFGGALKKESFIKDGYAVYEQSHAIYSNYDSFRYYISKVKFNELKRFAVNPNDIIMSCSGTMGKFSIVPRGAKKGIINQALLKLTVYSGFDIRFIKTSFELPFNQEQLLCQSAGGAIKNVVSVDQIKKICVCIPNFYEQQKIADCLSSVDELISAEDKKLALLKTHKKGLMQKLFNQEMRLKDKQGIRFSAWRKENLKDVCLSISSGKSEKGENINGFPLYGSTGIIGKTDIAEYDGEFLLVARVGANAGNTYIINGKCGISDNTLVIDVDKEKIVLCYLGYFLCNYDLNKLIFGSGQPLITGTQLKTIELQLPSLPEQQKIADCLSSLDDHITAQTKKIEALKLHKKGLMQGLFPSAQDVFG